jgi:hypothetical protein
MKLTRLGFSLVLLYTSTVAFGQEDTTLVTTRPAVQYFNQFLAGGLIGSKEYGVSVSANMVHGVRYKHGSIGVGVSYDQYKEWRTMPIFGMLSLDFAPAKEKSVIFQLASGITRVRHIDTANDSFNYHEKGGTMFQPSLGFRINAERWKLYMVAGYRHQRIRYSETPRWWSGVLDDVPYRNTTVRDMNRVIVQIGFGFN